MDKSTALMLALAVALFCLIIFLGKGDRLIGIGRQPDAGESAAYWANAEFAITNHSLVELGSGSSSMLQIKNNKNRSVRLTALYFDGRSAVVSPALPQTLAPNASVVLLARPAELNCGGGSGSSYVKNVEIEFELVGSGLVQRFEGEKPIVGICR